jgi:acyl-CoA reductase-like NAD-dependent aldehyde dehydrogenase
MKNANVERLESRTASEQRGAERVPPKLAVAPFLDGVLSASQSERIVDVMNPSTGRLCLQLAAGSDADVDRAVASARKAFDDGRWSEAAPSVRKQTLHRFADLITAHAKELDALDAAEMGKPVQEGFASAAVAAGLMRFHAEAVDKLLGDVYTSDKNSFVLQRLVPRGVVAALVPWNFPTFVAALKIAPALVAGNSVVLKPSELSSRSSLRLAQLALEAGIPAGVLNVVPGLGETVGRALGLHGDVDMLTFTGSTAAGKLMLQYSGQSNMKVVMAECGGKCPQIVFDDGVDLDVASDRIARQLLVNQGQVCSVGSRLLVQRSVQDRVVDKIVSRFEQIVMGDALDPKTTFGPVASEKQCARVMQYIEGAQREGIQAVIGGRRARLDAGGYFIEPTLFRDVAPNSRIAQEEIFGPVLSVIPFEDEAEAIRIANGTMYGLVSYVWSANISTGMRMMKGIRSSIRINATGPVGEGSGYAASYEPAAQSGIGTESGMKGIESYLRRQLVSFSHA